MASRGNWLTLMQCKGHADAPSRAERFAALARSRRAFDLLVVGGGITGCGIAREAALRGLRWRSSKRTISRAARRAARRDSSTAASATSSTGICISCSSRAPSGDVCFARAAPRASAGIHLAGLRGRARAALEAGAGLTLYDALALFRNVARHRRLSARDVLEREPGASRPTGCAAARAITTQRPTTRGSRSPTRSAPRNAARSWSTTRASTPACRATAACAVRTFGTSDRRRDRRAARRRVNATGPWSDALRALDAVRRPADARSVRGSKGAHIAVPRDAIGNHAALTLLSPADGRVMFVLPRGTHAIIGTTDTFTASSPDDVRATRRRRRISARRRRMRSSRARSLWRATTWWRVGRHSAARSVRRAKRPAPRRASTSSRPARADSCRSAAAS